MAINDERKAIASMTKTKFSIFTQQIKDVIPDETTQSFILEKLKEVLNFDPDATFYKGYTPGHCIAMQRYREKRRALKTI